MVHDPLSKPQTCTQHPEALNSLDRQPNRKLNPSHEEPKNPNGRVDVGPKVQVFFIYLRPLPWHIFQLGKKTHTLRWNGSL